ncbi:MAG: hypothetical protein LBV19_05830 [Streptococcaceae bacterium]|jgi:hypothetical protein|nr:hypothetical protein [Streptococcaceae bacterium]
MATKQEWREYFNLVNDREPSIEEFKAAIAKGEITDSSAKNPAPIRNTVPQSGEQSVQQTAAPQQKMWDQTSDSPDIVRKAKSITADFGQKVRTCGIVIIINVVITYAVMSSILGGFYGGFSAISLLGLVFPIVFIVIGANIANQQPGQKTGAMTFVFVWSIISLVASIWNMISAFSTMSSYSSLGLTISDYVGISVILAVIAGLIGIAMYGSLISHYNSMSKKLKALNS